MEKKTQKEGFLIKKAVVVAQDRNGNMIARKAGTGLVKAEEIDAVIDDFIHPSVLLCTDTATNYKKFVKIKDMQHEAINVRQKQRVKKGIYHIQHVNNLPTKGLDGAFSKCQNILSGSILASVFTFLKLDPLAIYEINVFMIINKYPRSSK